MFAQMFVDGGRRLVAERRVKAFVVVASPVNGRPQLRVSQIGDHFDASVIPPKRNGGNFSNCNRLDLNALTHGYSDRPEQ